MRTLEIGKMAVETSRRLSKKRPWRIMDRLRHSAFSRAEALELMRALRATPYSASSYHLVYEVSPVRDTALAN